MSAPRRFAVAVSVPAVIAAGLAVAVPATAATQGYQGTSFPIKIQVGLVGSTLLDEILPDVVTFPAGGDTSLLELPTELSEVATLKVLNAVSGVKDQTLASNARTAQLSVLNDLVTASVLNADCTASNLKLAGDSQVTNLAIAGTKVPIDPGPNFKIEIPAALVPFLSGGIFIDEQDTLPTGELRVRALHVRLVVDPLGLQAALDGVLGEVRRAAEQVKGAVETATGRTLEVLETEARTARGALDPAAQKAAVKKAEPKVNASRAQDEATAAAEKQTARQRLVAQRDAEAAAAEKAAVEMQRRADAAAAAAETAARADAPAEPASGERAAGQDVAGQEAAGQEAAGQEAARTGVGTERADRTVTKKADRAAVAEREAAAAQAARAKAQTWQQRANRLSPEQARDAAAKAQADAAEARKAADAAHARAAAARAGAPDTESAPAPARSGAASTGVNKTDRAGAAPTKATVPAAEADNLGTVGVDVIVSQVTCKGFQAVQAVNKPPAKKPAEASSVDKPKELPKTGGNGGATAAVGVAGLGLLIVGSGAVFAVRRRRHSA